MTRDGVIHRCERCGKMYFCERLVLHEKQYADLPENWCEDTDAGELCDECYPAYKTVIDDFMDCFKIPVIGGFKKETDDG